jgi:NTE family protein
MHKRADPTWDNSQVATPASDNGSSPGRKRPGEQVKRGARDDSSAGELPESPLTPGARQVFSTVELPESPVVPGAGRVALVLGAGGTVGMAYHVGVLRALRDGIGFDPTAADLVVGTSAGAVIGAYLRSGLELEEMWRQTFGDGVSAQGQVGEEGSALPREHIRVFAPAFHSPIDLAAHALGSAFVLARSAIRIPLPALPAFLMHAFPGGMFSLAEGRQRLEHDLPTQWPAAPLWLCAVDIVSGRRVVLGRGDTPSVSLVRAVMASAAIPGVYPPVHVGNMVLVDGGVHSSTNLDLATVAGCDLVIGVAPLAYDTEDHNPLSPARLFRRPPAVSLAHEVAVARKAGAKVYLVRPVRAEVDRHGFNLMRRDGLDEIAERAYAETTARLETPRFKEMAQLLEASRARRNGGGAAVGRTPDLDPLTSSPA